MGAPTGDPLTDLVNWTALNRAMSDGDPAITANQSTDSFGMPMYSSATCNYLKDFPDLSPYNAVRTMETNESLIVLAQLKPDGTFEYLKNVQVTARIQPDLNKASFQKLRLAFFGSEVNQDSLWATTYT